MWRQHDTVPHHVLVQVGDEPDDARDRFIGTFNDPADAELAVELVNLYRELWMKEGAG